MSVKVGEMFFDLVGRDKAFTRMMDNAESRVKRAGQRMGQFGAMMIRNVTLPLAAAGGAIIKFGGDFDAAMTRSVAIMGNVSDAMRRDMSQAAIDVSTTTSFAANEAAEAYFFLASAGLDAAQAIEALPAVASFAQAGAFDLALATDLLTDAQSALGMASEDAAENLANMTRIGDVLVKANTLANASVQQFASSLTNGVAAAARNAGIEVEEVTAVLAALADQGLKGEAAGTALTGVLTVLPRIAGENAAEFAALGIRVFDAEGNMRALADIVDDVTASMGDMNDEQMAAAFSAMGLNRNILDTMKQLMGTSDKIREYEADLRNAAGMMDEVAEKQLKTLQEQVKLLKDQVIAIGLAFYEDWEPSLRSANESMQEMTQSIRDMDPEMRRATTTIALVAGGVGIAVTAISKLVGVAANVVAAFKWIVSAGGAVVGFLGGPITVALTALAITAVAAFNQITERGDGFWSWFIDGWRATGRGATQAAGRMASAIGGFFAGMYRSAVGAAKSLYSGVRSWLVGKFGSIVAGVQRQIDRVKSAFRSLYHAVVGGSYVPDMITEVKAWMLRLGSDALVDPATASTKEAAKAFKEMNESIKRTLADLGTQLRTSQFWASVTGDEWGAMRQEASALEGAIKVLVAAGHEHDAVTQELIRQYRVLTVSVEGHEAALAHEAEQQREATEAAREAEQVRRQQEQAVQQFISGAETSLLDALREEETQHERLARQGRELLGLYPELDAELRKYVEALEMLATRQRQAEEAQAAMNKRMREAMQWLGYYNEALTDVYATQSVLIAGQDEWREGAFTDVPADLVRDVDAALARIPDDMRDVRDTADETTSRFEEWVVELADAQKWMGLLGVTADSVAGRVFGAANAFQQFGGGWAGGIAGALTLFGTNLGEILDGFLDAWKSTMRWFERIGRSIVGGIRDVFGWLVDAIEGTVGVVGDVVGGVWDVITAPFRAIGKFIGLADGGTIRTPGSVMVGERGPEILHLPRGATVEPLDLRGGRSAGGSFTAIIELDGREIARKTVPHMANEMRLKGAM